MISFKFEATGTTWEITAYDEVENESKLEGIVKKYINEFEDVYSRFRPNTLVSKISVKPGTYEFPLNAEPLFQMYSQLYQTTHAAFSPFIGKTLVELGYDPDYSLQKKGVLTTTPIWEELIEYNAPNLTVKVPIQMDFGAAGKGYLMDLVADLLKQKGVTNYNIDAGHDLLYKNQLKPLKVGLEHPTDTDKVIGFVDLLEGSICASSGNRRKLGNQHHIVDAVKLKSPENILATWVIAPTGLIADALATCLFFVDPDILMNSYQFDYLILYNDFSITKSPGFKGELFHAK